MSAPTTCWSPRRATCASGSRSRSASFTASASPTCCARWICRRRALGWSLFSFNLGVEIGQLLLVLLVASALAWIARAQRARAGRASPSPDRSWSSRRGRSGSFNGCFSLEEDHETWDRGSDSVGGRRHRRAGHGDGAGDGARPNVVEVEKVKDNLYMITGGGGNTAVFITADGVVVVDTKLAGWGQAILDQDQDRHAQAGHDDHQHAYARRSRRQQRRVPGDGRLRRAGEHQGEHGEDGAVPDRERQVSIFPRRRSRTR